MIESKQTINQRYQLQEKLGERPACQTWLALDLETNSRVVIKLLTFGGQTYWNDLKLFEREKLILKRLNHKFIPKYLNRLRERSHQELYRINSRKINQALLVVKAWQRRCCIKKVAKGKNCKVVD